MLDVRAGGRVRFDLFRVALTPTAANLSVMTKWMSLIAHCISIGFFFPQDAEIRRPSSYDIASLIHSASPHM